jgi:hypothetical protein
VKDVQVLDGVAVAIRGNTFVSMWQRSATLNRVRWHGALLEQHVAKHRGKALGLMVVHSTAAPPQGAARVESNAIVRRIGAQMLLSVTAVLGDTVQLQVVRSIMRGMFLLSGNVKRHLVVSSESEAIDRVLALVEPPAPSRAELAAAVRALHSVLAAEPAAEEASNPAID